MIMRWAREWLEDIARDLVKTAVTERLGETDLLAQAYERRAQGIAVDVADMKRRLSVLEAGLPRKIAKRVRRG